MAEDTVKIIPENLRTDYIGVDSYNDMHIVGRYRREGAPQKPFSSVMELLELMRESVERVGFPDAYDRIKSFSEVPKSQVKTGSGENDSVPEGALATFVVKVLFRQNSSWQGVITWIEGRREESFRSVYEMLMLMDSALESAKGRT